MSATWSLATKMSAMLPGTVTSWPLPIDRTMSCAGLTTDWAMAGPVDAVASGARAHAAISADFRRRLFIVLPLIFVSLAVVRRLFVLIVIIGFTAGSTCRAARRGRPNAP